LDLAGFSRTTSYKAKARMLRYGLLAVEGDCWARRRATFTIGQI
jgi:hypothetical protein